jgi:choline dehydrogenase-like flavoprotein
VKRADGQPFHKDPVYDEIRKSLGKLAEKLLPKGVPGEFQNPFFNKVTQELEADSIALSHPLGGCIMGQTAAAGVVDEFGHVFDKTKTGPRPFYEGLFIADGSIVPTALAVNPTLTISSLALRIADNLIVEKEWDKP